jgi:hypothetical protein
MCKWPLEKYKVVDNFAGLDEHKLGQWDSSHRHRTRVLFGRVPQNEQYGIQTERGAGEVLIEKPLAKNRTFEYGASARWRREHNDISVVASSCDSTRRAGC